MKSLTIQLLQPAPKRYQVFVAPGLLKSLPKLLKQLKPAALQFKSAARYIIITDSIVKKIAGEKLLATLKKAGLQADLIAFPSGEKNKNEQTHRNLTHQMLAKKCGRDTMILALGGGVVGDTAGYVAATYMRGIPYVQIPTSFLAMVDSSIGGKVGVDTPYGKNLIGAFWHPEAIFADIDCLKNLPREQLVNGLMEAVKIFLTYDKSFFEFTRKNWSKITNRAHSCEAIAYRAPRVAWSGDTTPKARQEAKQARGFATAGAYQKRSEAIIARAIELKIGVVVRDEHDLNERMVVNWGHTIGHAIEHLSNYKLLHGFSVALGILVESKIAQLLKVLSEKDFQTVCEAMKQFGINAKDLQKFSAEKIIELTTMDKKSANGKVKYVMLQKIGKAKTDARGMFGHEVDIKTVREALHFFTTPKILKK